MKLPTGGWGNTTKEVKAKLRWYCDKRVCGEAFCRDKISVAGALSRAGRR